MTCGSRAPRASRHARDTILYPETPACIVQVRSRHPGALELCTLFRRDTRPRFTRGRRPCVTITHTAATSKNGVVVISARSKRRCPGKAPGGTTNELMVITAPALVAHTRDESPSAFCEYPVVVMKNGRWMPCAVVDSALAPSKYQELQTATPDNLHNVVWPCLPAEMARGTSAVVVTLRGTIDRVLECARAGKECKECAATVYSSVPPTKVYNT
jgi:hypothetical protein